MLMNDDNFDTLKASNIHITKKHKSNQNSKGTPYVFFWLKKKQTLYVTWKVSALKKRLEEIHI